MSTKYLQLLGSDFTNHEHENLNLYDTVSGTETIDINAAEPQCPLEVTLTSETYTDFSNITVTLTNGENGQSIVSGADGVVVGLSSEPEFKLVLSSTEADFDPTLVTITCKYKLDVGHVLHDYVLHVDMDSDSDGDGINDNNVIIDDTLSITGAAADAKAVGAAIDNLESNKVSIDRTINGKSLITNVVLSASDVNAVPVTRTINGKSLDENITLTAKDIGAIGNIETDDTLTIEGMPADAKITGNAINNLEKLVGGTSVATQISEALVNIDDNVYVQGEEPEDAEDGALWVDTSMDGESNIGTSLSGIPTITAEDEDKMIQVVGGKYTLVSIKESSIATYVNEYINEALEGEY